jgi:competence transcription factor ComK
MEFNFISIDKKVNVDCVFRLFSILDRSIIMQDSCDIDVDIN